MATLAGKPLRPIHPSARPRVTAAPAEWPTWVVIGGHYGAFAALTWFWTAIPLWIALPAAAYLICLNGHIMHEVLHGHPTRNARINRLTMPINLGGWIPYEIFRDTHIAHHASETLADPIDDPESFYVTPESWARMSAPMRWLRIANNAAIGRMLIGPFLVIPRFLWEEARRIARGDTAYLGAWAALIASNIALAYWLFAVCGVPIWQFFLAWYAGAGLMVLRSYLEHRPASDQDARCAIVEAGPLMQLLFLNNSYHLIHHDRPGLPWYEIPKVYRNDLEIWRRRSGYVFRGGYLEVFRRFGLRPKDSPVHPGA